MKIKNDINQYDEESPVRGNIDIQPQNSRRPRVAHKKYMLLPALAMGLAAIGAGFIVSCTVMIMYGMNSLNGEPEGLLWLIEDAVRLAPAVRGSLSPAFCDVLNDRRRPDYRRQLEITARTHLGVDSNGKWRTVVTVVNNGTETVSLLPLRVVVLDSDRRIIAESTEFAATPLAAEPYWRGPLTGGSTRHINCVASGVHTVASAGNVATEVEVADIRIWVGERQDLPADGEAGKGAK